MSRTLSEIIGAEVWLKFENLQFTAAYKERGALNKLLQLTDEERARGVIAASAGNHAQAVAYHGQRLGIPVTIVMPVPTPIDQSDADRRPWRARRSCTATMFDDAYANARELEAEEGYRLRPSVRRPADHRRARARSRSRCWRTRRTSTRWSFRSAAAASCPASRPPPRPSSPTSS